MASRILRPIRIECEIAYIPLTQGMTAIIDAADVPLVEMRNWFARRDKTTFYAATNITRPDGQTSMTMHGLILGVGADHIDGDGLNCRRSNLRRATHEQNVRNRRLGRNNSSGLKGVWIDRKSGRWRSSITVRRQAISLGSHDTAEAAHAAYCDAARVYFGEFWCPG